MTDLEIACCADAAVAEASTDGCCGGIPCC